MRLKCMLFGMTLFVLAPLYVMAASATGTLVGTVSDPHGSVLRGAKVTARNQQSNLVRSAITNAEGEYLLGLMPPGSYELMVEMPGFARVVHNPVTLAVNEVRRLNTRLSVDPVKLEVAVTGSVPQLETDSVTLGQVTTNSEIDRLPLNERNFLNFALLASGVQVGADGAQPSIGALAIAVNGAREQSNNFLLDGVDNNDRSLNYITVLPSADAIQEFKVQSSNSSVEFGQGGGAQINVVLKSGTNDFHGSLFEFIRNRHLDAKNSFDPPACTRRSAMGTCGDIPRFDRNQFGGTVGGPIRRDRTFFFISYEGLRLRQANTRHATVPSQLQREAALSAVPPSGLNPAGLAVLNLLPAANVGPDLRTSNVFVSSPNVEESVNLFLLKLEQKLGANDTLSGHYAITDANVIYPFDPFFAFTNLPGYGSRVSNRGHNIRASEEHVFSPQLVGELRVGFNRLGGTVLQENLGTDKARLLGFPSLAKEPIDFGYPQVVIAGFDGIGEPFNLPNNRVVTTFQVGENLVWNPKFNGGRHFFFIGGDLHRLQLNSLLNMFSRGRWAFLGGPNRNTLEELVRGIPNFALTSQGDTHLALRTTETALYMQDNIRPTSTLTLSLGLGWEYRQPPVELRNRLDMPDLSPRSLTCSPRPACQFSIAGTAGLPRGLYNSSWQYFAPRIGVSWHPIEHLVFRSSYGIFRDVTPFEINIFPHYNPPFFSITTFPNAGTNTIQNILEQAALNVPPLVRTIDRNFHDGYMQQWHSGLQSDALRLIMLEVDYVGSKGTHLPTHIDLNQVSPGTGPPPFPQFGPIDTFISSASSSYNSLQLRAERRFRNSWSLLVAYTWSKSIDNASTVFGTAAETGLAQNSDDLRAERALSDFHTPHRLVISDFYQLPFGPGRHWLNKHSGAEPLLGNWEVGAIFAIQSGRPFTVNRGIDQSLSGTAALGLFADRPDQIANPFQPGPMFANPEPACHVTIAQGGLAADHTRTVETWFNRCAFAAPTSPRFGTARRNSVIGPGFSELDLSLGKNVSIRDGKQLQFRFEVFNAVNRANFDIPNRIFDSARFSALQSANAFGNKPPRQIQLLARYQF